MSAASFFDFAAVENNSPLALIDNYYEFVVNQIDIEAETILASCGVSGDDDDDDESSDLDDELVELIHSTTDSIRNCLLEEIARLRHVNCRDYAAARERVDALFDAFVATNRSGDADHKLATTLKSVLFSGGYCTFVAKHAMCELMRLRASHSYFFNFGCLLTASSYFDERFVENTAYATDLPILLSISLLILSNL